MMKMLFFKCCLFLSLVYVFNFYGQDSTIKYRVTSIHASGSHFFLIAPKYPQLPHFFPSGVASVKSFRTDSASNPFEKIHFMITTGAAASRFTLTNDAFYKNILDKSPMTVFSRRFFGGFGINIRRKISEKFTLDIDVAPCVQIIWDKSEETRMDTALEESKGFEEIYQGLHLFTNFKLERATKKDFGFYISLSGSLPLINKFDRINDDYSDRFKGQVMIGIGLVYFHRSKRKVENTTGAK